MAEAFLLYDNERCVSTNLKLVFEHFEEFLPDDLLLALPHR